MANGVILGKVVDAVTKAPLPGVLVDLGPQPRLRTLTDAQGRYVFRLLPPGRYAIAATMGSNGFEQSGFLVTGLGHLIAPYLNGGFGQRRPNGPLQNLNLEQGAVVTDAVISLWKGASIDGTVVDETNEPLVGIVVAAVRRTSDGVMTTGPTTRTDDRGMYHISALAPGDYVVVVPQTQVLLPVSASEEAFAPVPDPLLGRKFTAAGAPSPGAVGVLIGSVVAATTPPAAANVLPAPGDRARHVYQSTFHPSATTLGQAGVVTLASGDEVNGVDVQLRPVPAAPVGGVLLDGGVPVPHFGVRLMPVDTGDGAEVMDVALSATDGQGRFTFPLVPAGQYRLVAQRQTAVPIGTTPQGGLTFAEPRSVAESAGAWAESSVVVSEAPGGDVILSLRPGFRAGGRVVFDGAGTPPPRERLNQFTITAVPVRASRRHLPPVSGSRIDASGNFSIAAVAPGRYILNWPETLPGWSVESVTIAGRDVTDAAFEVVHDITDIVITFTEQPASISGLVRSKQGPPDNEASVFMFPADRGRWREARSTSRAVRTVRVDANGGFTFPNVIPGEYLVVAVPDSQADDWPDQRLIARLGAAASTVRVTPRQRSALTLSIMEIR